MDVDLSRVRRPSKRFGWVDRRLLAEGHLASVSAVPVSLYLVLCVVADRHGVSWYAPATLAEWVKCPADRIRPALECLKASGLVALAGRHVQVLDLDLLVPAPAVRRPVGDVRREPTRDEPPTLSAHGRLEQLPADVREGLLSRARAQLVRYTRGREPSRSALEAVAAGLIDRGAA